MPLSAKVDLRELIRTEKNMLSITGLYPRKSMKCNVFYNLRSFITLSVAYGQICMLFVQLYMDRKDFSRLTETLLYFMTHFTFLCKLFNFYLKRRSVLKIEHETLADSILYDFSEDDIKLVRQKMEMTEMIAKSFRFCCICCFIFYGLVPYLDNSSKNMLPLNGSLPYDTAKYYYVTYVFQLLGIAVSAYNNSTIDILTWKLIAINSAEYDILKIKLHGIDFLGSPGKVEGILNKCIRRHDGTLKLTDIVEGTFSSGIFIQFFCSVIVICVTTFQILMVAIPSIKFFVLLTYIAAMMVQVATYCWFGNDVITTSNDIGQALYTSNWYNSDLNIRKSVVILMTRTQKPVLLKAGFVTLSLVTLTQIMRSSYSYLAVLRHMYGDDD